MDKETSAGRKQHPHQEVLGWASEIGPLDSLVGTLTTSAAIEPAKVFAATLAEIHALKMVPFRVAAEGVRLFYWTIGYTVTSLRNTLNDTKSTLPEDIIRQRTQDANSWLEKQLGSEENLTEFASLTDSSLANICSRGTFLSSLGTINSQSTVALWTAFECLARDLWVNALNNSSVSVAHKAFNCLEREDAARKSVSISELAKHGFDIRQKVGSILEAKLVFTDFPSIQKAFRIIDEKAVVSTSDDERQLFLLEKARHLIVHRAGYVDQKYKSETSTSAAIGSRISIDPAQLTSWFEAVVRTGSSMISLVEKTHGP